MSAPTEWHLEREAAERYERILVPAILGPFAQALVDWAGPRPGEVVLDAGCGTGSAARHAAVRVGPAGRVVGVDISAGMIDVARSLPPISGSSGSQAPIDWRQESVYHLPILNQSIDLVLCAQTLQFLGDRHRALVEIHRVLKPGGRIAISLWMPIIENPYFHSLVEAVTAYVGAETAAGLKAAFNLSDPALVRDLLLDVEFRALTFSTKELYLTLPPMSEFVPRHVSATPMASGYASASSTARQAVVDEMTARMANYARDGKPRVPFRSHLVQAAR